jgi:tetratricopeptide (TPR) repeat protein
MPAERQLAHVERLERSLRAAYKQAWPQREIVALLKELLRQEVNPERHPLLRVQLAEALLSLESPSRQQSWQAAKLARSVSKDRISTGTPSSVSDVSWLLARAEAAQGLAHTLLGHYSLARSCYERAHQLDPEDPAVNHNLGHLLACVFAQESRALHYLEAAWRGLPNELEVAASFAQVLSRVGQLSRARSVLSRAGVSNEQAGQWLQAWALRKPGA